jgi:formamidopyrimidine-DNA glycosylase
MPELPEVETIKRGLEKKIVGLQIKDIQTLSIKSFMGDPKFVVGKKVIAVKRRAKILQIDLAGELSIIFHLKMSGQVIYQGQDRFVGGHPTKDMFLELPNKHTRVIFEFSDGSHLYFNDQRKFGWVKVVADDQVREEVKKMFGQLGPEPLEKGFTWEVLKKNLLRHKSMPVKVAILDQSVVSGVGNIYACEALFLAGVDPRRRVSELSDQEIKGLTQGIIKSLETGISFGGSTLAHFVDEEGKKGLFLDHALVYNRAGKECKKCGSEIKKIRLGGRGTYYCPVCQE